MSFYSRTTSQYYCVISTNIFLQSLYFLLELATSIIPVPMTDSLQYNHGLFIGNSGNLRSIVLLNHGSKTDTLLINNNSFVFFPSLMDLSLRKRAEWSQLSSHCLQFESYIYLLWTIGSILLITPVHKAKTICEKDSSFHGMIIND